MITLPTWHREVLFAFGALGSWLFIYRYMRTYRWWSTALGRHMIAFSAIVGAWFTYIPIVLIWPHLPGREIVGTVLIVVLVLTVWWRVWMFERLDRAVRKEKRTVTNPVMRKLGRQPNRGRDRVSLRSDHMPATYMPPVTLDRYGTVPASLWGMDGNDAVGDCTCADVHHEVLSMQAAARNPLVQATTQEILAAYSAITGYNPADPNTDQGAEMQAVRDYWRKTGFTLGGRADKILLFADINFHDTVLVKWCLDQFGAIGLGVNFPRSAMDQFDAGQPWMVVHGSPIEGGHAVALVGYDADWWYVLTWGRVQKVAPTWFTEYVEEAWTVLSEDFVNAKSGDDVLGGTLYDLGAQFSAVTKQPNPVPAPSPVPTPTPKPTPVPVDAADRALAQVLRPWVTERHVGENRRVANVANAWLIDKGL